MKSLQQYIDEKLVINKGAKQKNNDIKNIKTIDQPFCNTLNTYLDEKNSYHDVRFMCYKVNGEPHLFVKKTNKTDINDSPKKYSNQYDRHYVDFLWELMMINKKNMLNDTILDNLFMYYAKWNFIDRSSRINNSGGTAHGFYIPENGMLFNSKKEANKFVKDNKLRTPHNNKALHAKSLREILDLYKYCQDNYQYDRPVTELLEK